MLPAQNTIKAIESDANATLELQLVASLLLEADMASNVRYVDVAVVKRHAPRMTIVLVRLWTAI
jgi:hypothetical protein